MNTLKRLTEEFQREHLAQILAKCSPAQQEFFHRLYPNGVPADKLTHAYDQCERTVKKNEADPSRLK